MSDYVNFESGTIISRVVVYNDDIEETMIKVYDRSHFANDMGININLESEFNEVKVKKNAKINVVKEHDIILNLSTCECVIATKNSDGCLLPYNYSKVIVNDELDPDYFVGWFNYSDEARTQIKTIQLKSKEKPVPKMTHKILKNLNITVPNKNQQTVIGKLVNTFQWFKKMNTQQNEMINQYIRSTYIN